MAALVDSGLVAMRQRVEQLSGTLLVETAAGHGTTLVVNLPMDAQRSELPSD